MKKLLVILMAIPIITAYSFADITLYSENFEDGSTDWGGSIIAETSGNHYLEFNGGGSYSWLGGPRTNMGPNWSSQVDVYLDPAFAGEGYGFEFSQATTDIGGNIYVQDNVFHVGAYFNTTSQKYELGVTAVHPHHATSGEGNSPTYYPQNAYTNDGSLYTVTEAGWYTFQYTFSQAAGDVEAIHWSMKDASGPVLYSYDDQWAKDASQMGGNSYMWFIGRGSDYAALQIDNVLLTSAPAAVPVPGAFLLGSLGVGVVGWMKRRRAL